MRTIIVLDIEGVLLPRKAVLMMRLASKMGIKWLIKNIIRGVLYQLRILDLKKIIKGFYNDLIGISLQELWNVYPLHDLDKRLKCIKKLSEAGYDLILISSGVPQEFVNYLGKRVGAKAAYGVNLLVDKRGIIKGVGNNPCIEKDGKIRLVAKHVSPGDKVIVIADDWNNLQLRTLADIFIGFNPDSAVAAKADLVLEDDQFEELPKYILSGELPSRNFGRVFLRKLIHMSGIVLIPLLTFVDSKWIILLLLLAFLLYGFSEFLRTQGFKVPIISWITEHACRGRESSGLAFSPLAYVLGLLILLSLPPPYLYVSILVLTLGDGMAGLLDNLIKGHSLPHNRSKKLEAILLGFLPIMLPALYFAPSIIVVVLVLCGMIAEALSYLIPDDITISLTELIVSMIMLFTGLGS